MCGSQWETLTGDENAFKYLGSGSTISTARYGCCPANKYMSSPEEDPFVESTSCSACPVGQLASSEPNDDTSCLQATCAQITDGVAGGSFSCAAGSSPKSNPETIKCGATPCAANSDATENARCCYQATCAQITDGVVGGTFSCGVGSSLKNNPETIKCGTTPCAANSDDTQKSLCCFLECEVGEFPTLTFPLTCKTCETGYNDQKAQQSCKDCDAGSFISSDRTKCNQCIEGQWQNETNQLSCKKCTAGKILKQIGQSSNTCEECVIGQYNPYEGHPESCLPCPAASYNGASECDGCDPGKYKNRTIDDSDGDDECNVCILGKFTNERDVLLCKECPKGYYTNDQKSTDDVVRRNRCQECPRGTYGDQMKQETKEECKNCNAGRYSDVEGVSKRTSIEVVCKACVAGRYSKDEGNVKDSDCENCGSGTWSSTEAATSDVACKPCGIGRYSDDVGVFDNASCTVCDVGSEQIEEGKAYCLPCAPGKFGTIGVNKISVCQSCPDGKFSQVIQALQCQLPNDGYIAGPSKAGQVEVAVGFRALCELKNGEKICTGMKRCSAGTFEKNRTCFRCEAGQYSKAGSIKCDECDQGRFSAQEGSQECSICEAKNGRYSDQSGLLSCKICQSGKISTGKTCYTAPLDASLPVLQNLRTVVSATNTTKLLNYSIANIQWDAYTTTDTNKISPVAAVLIQWSNDLEFPDSTDNIRTGSKRIDITNELIRSQPGNIQINIATHFSTLLSSILYARVRTLGQDGRSGEWSTPTEKWTVTSDCLRTSYLNVSIGTDLLNDPSSWKCFPCPVGASCLGDITWDGVIATFGYWRVPGSAPNEFIKCPFPGACLGAKNPKQEGKFYNKSWIDGKWVEFNFDYAQHRLTEGCNTYYGFKQESRLCHTCVDDFKRLGRDRCSGCPTQGQNFGLLFLAVLLLTVGGIAVAYLAIKDAGKAEQSEIIRKIMFNFLQVSALAANFPLHWPPELEALFDFQGAISTAGEHLLNPDCSVRGVSPADLFYGKQIGYAMTPPLLALLIFVIWRLYSICAGVEWKNRATEITHTPKDKMVVTICVLLYFFWPTSLKQTFQMFSCRRIGAGEATYLMAE